MDSDITIVEEITLRFLGFNKPIRKDYYQCPCCGYILRKEDATVSGYDSQPSLRHVYCPRCGGFGKQDFR